MQFEWGLIAVNTRKSIYKPGETAEFEIVVLDKYSFGVPAAKVTLSIALPNGSTEVLSTENGGIIETTSSGIYVANLLVLEEGTYNVKAHALSTEIDSSIETSFEVRSDFEFDILRQTITKLNPEIQPNNVRFEITALKGQKKADIKERVPKEFGIIVGRKEIVEIDEITTEILAQDPNIQVLENESEKIIEWKNVEFNSEGKAILEYDYTVPADKKPWLYLIGPLEIIEANSVFFEARAWMIAIDNNPATMLFFRNTAQWYHSEPAPNASASGDSFLAGSTWTSRGMNDVLGTSNTTAASGTVDGASGYVSLISFVSPPLVDQTIASGTWTAAGTFYESATNDDLQARLIIYGWSDSNDSKTGNIVAAATITTEVGLAAAPTNRRLSGTGGLVKMARGDKIIVEIEFYGTTPTSAIGTLHYGGNNGTVYDSNMNAPVLIRFAGDLNTGFTLPANNSSKSKNEAFDVNVFGNCNYYDCGDTNVTLQYCVNTTQGCNAFFDMNTVNSSPLYISTGPADITDLSLATNDVNSFGFIVTPTQTGTFTIRSKIDSNWSADINYSNQSTTGDINVIVGGHFGYSFNNPDTDANTFTLGENFIANAVVFCNDANCGSVDTNLQYCPGTGCTSFWDMNNAAGAPLQIITGTNPDTNVTLNTGLKYDVNWVIVGNLAGTYELRLRSLGTKADANNTSGTDKTVVIQAATDYSFVLMMPTSGCTAGKGRLDAGDGACQKGYFEVTTGGTDQNKVNPEGQTSTIPFFVIDNQSSSNDDLNIYLDLNQALTNFITMKISQIYGGWNGVCRGNTDTNCSTVSTVAKSFGKAVFVIGGAKDLNLFIWSDFNKMAAGRVDRNVDVNSMAPT